MVIPNTVMKFNNFEYFQNFVSFFICRLLYACHMESVNFFTQVKCNLCGSSDLNSSSMRLCTVLHETCNLSIHWEGHLIPLYSMSLEVTMQAPHANTSTHSLFWDAHEPVWSTSLGARDLALRLANDSHTSGLSGGREMEYRLLAGSSLEVDRAQRMLKHWLLMQIFPPTLPSQTCVTLTCPDPFRSSLLWANHIDRHVVQGPWFEHGKAVLQQAGADTSRHNLVIGVVIDSLDPQLVGGG